MKNRGPQNRGVRYKDGATRICPGILECFSPCLCVSVVKSFWSGSLSSRESYWPGSRVSLCMALLSTAGSLKGMGKLLPLYQAETWSR